MTTELTKLSNSDLILSLKRLTKAERKITHLVLLHIIEVENRRLHLQLGYDRIFSYLTRELGYSEYSAYERIRAADLLKKIPEVSEKIESGALNLTQITEVQKCLKEKVHKGEVVSTAKTLQILKNIENKSGFETQIHLAQEFNRPIKQYETTRPQKDESVRIEVTFNKEQFAELKMAKELLSHVCPGGSWSEVITTLAKKMNQTKLGKKLLKNGTTETAAENRSIATQSFLGSSETKVTTTKGDRMNAMEDRDGNINKDKKNQKYRPYISIKTRRSLLAQAHHQCEHHHPQSGRCTSKYQLQVDHIQPLAAGGDHKISNLRILCGIHNRARTTGGKARR